MNHKKSRRAIVRILIFRAAALTCSSARSRTRRSRRFAPQGEAKGVRQVTARFSASHVVAFGDPRLTDPFTVQCEGDAAAAQRPRPLGRHAQLVVRFRSPICRPDSAAASRSSPTSRRSRTAASKAARVRVPHRRTRGPRVACPDRAQRIDRRRTGFPARARRAGRYRLAHRRMVRSGRRQRAHTGESRSRRRKRARSSKRTAMRRTTSSPSICKGRRELPLAQLQDRRQALE